VVGYYPLEAHGTIEAISRFTIGPEPDLRKPLTGAPQDITDERPAESHAPKFRQDIEMTDATDCRIDAVGVDIEPTNPRRPSTKECDEQAFALSIETVGSVLPVREEPFEESKSFLTRGQEKGTDPDFRISAFPDFDLARHPT
jgi:hypothetical protein